MIVPTLLRLSAVAAALAGCGTDDPTADWTIGTGPAASVSGKAFVFGPSDGLTVTGATVAVAEAPEYAATVAADGTFALSAPSGAPISLRLEQPGFMPTQTAALPLDAGGLDQVGFQVPTFEMVDLLATFVRVTPDERRCQIATTVSRKDTEPYGGAALGEPGVVVAIEPPLPAEHGPVYFAYVNDETIFPDRALTETTIDGGVLYLNVPPGEYTLTATKVGKQFTQVTLRCAAGLLVNAAPPRGLQEL